MNNLIRDVVGFMIILIILPFITVFLLNTVFVSSIPYTWHALSVWYTWELSLFYMTLLPWYLFCYKDGGVQDFIFSNDGENEL